MTVFVYVNTSKLSATSTTSQCSDAAEKWSRKTSPKA
ncbi:hypothetical protein V1286_005122 [Bradyrhizobium algeriense]|uniref:Uncharacterized protein n=1 Tax=Bradyrhizobium algeriense TaxID=634784 RepID=A0ABU8BGA7_9BRAD